MKNQFRRRACAAALALCLCAAPARAQMPVIDPANLIQSVLQVTHMISQINNQIEQIRQQTLMLKRLGLELSPELSRSISASRQLLQQAEGLRQNAQTITEDLRALYPEDTAGYDFDALLSQSDRWLAESRASTEVLMALGAAASSDGLDEAERSISRALAASAGAEGQTSAEQATTQAVGVLSAQLAQLQALQAAQARALATERLERIAREERARDIRRRAFPASAGEPTLPVTPRF